MSRYRVPLLLVPTGGFILAGAAVIDLFGVEGSGRVGLLLVVGGVAMAAFHIATGGSLRPRRREPDELRDVGSVRRDRRALRRAARRAVRRERRRARFRR